MGVPFRVENPLFQQLGSWTQYSQVRQSVNKHQKSYYLLTLFIKADLCLHEIAVDPNTFSSPLN